MTRPRDWQSRYAAACAQHRVLDWRWGVHDCAMFGADCVLAATENDPALELRGTYADEAGARALLRRVGGIIELADAQFGRVEVAEARIADLGVAHSPNGPALVVCNGQTWLGARSPRGLAALQPSDVLIAWRV